MLRGAGLEENLLKRWCLAYWCFYSAATASRVCEADDFWEAMRRADLEKWPRGAERRHFRGKTSSGAVAFLSAAYPSPESAVDACGGTSFADVSARVRAWPFFGPWIAFKVADMLERVLGVPVDFSDCALGVYKEPAAGASLVASLEGLPDDVEIVTAWLLDRLGFRKAPPRYDRPINIQEAETVLCKFKSHYKGHYPVGKDVREIRHALSAHGGLCRELLACLPNA